MNTLRAGITVGIVLITALSIAGFTGIVAAHETHASPDCGDDQKYISVEGVHHDNAANDNGIGNKDMCVGGGEQPISEGENDDGPGCHISSESEPGKTILNPSDRCGN